MGRLGTAPTVNLWLRPRCFLPLFARSATRCTPSLSFSRSHGTALVTSETFARFWPQIGSAHVASITYESTPRASRTFAIFQTPESRSGWPGSDGYLSAPGVRSHRWSPIRHSTTSTTSRAGCSIGFSRNAVNGRWRRSRGEVGVSQKWMARLIERAHVGRKPAEAWISKRPAYQLLP